MEQCVNSEVVNGDTVADSPIKLFVGQVPRTWMESNLREIMEPFGAILELSILKDRATDVSKGCAFVTYVSKVSAAEAQNILHEKRTLPGMSHPMQVKPAAVTMDGKSDPVEERRLFVGMLSRDLTENDVNGLFSPYGHVEDVSILRNVEGRSKGAAFVRMDTRDHAQDAISSLHQSQTMAGCSAPLVVKIADTEREKSVKRLHQAAAANDTSPNMGYYKMQATGTTVNNSFGLGTSLHNPMGNLSSAMLTAASPLALHHAKPVPITNDALLNAYLGIQNHPMAAQLAVAGYGQPSPNMQNNNPGYCKQKEGPEGSNLFIYHLPNDVTDPDLVQMFSPFGSVISAKVFIDKVTNLSKCFGFISYDNPVSAQSAIQSMNGFQIGTKRLKVQLKRPREANKPY